MKKNIIVCAPTANTEWKWLLNRINFNDIDWHFIYYPKTRPIIHFGRTDIGKIISAWQSVLLARKINTKLIVSHEAETTFWIGLFVRLLGLDVPHVAVSFNYPFRPRFIRRWLMTKAFKHVDGFDVSSSVEKKLYYEYFKIPEEKIHVSLWKVQSPATPRDAPIVADAYVCAIGQFGRDYKTLLVAAINLPQIKFVLVVRQGALDRFNVPENVSVFTDISYQDSVNILYYSKFMLLPLLSQTMPTGHITIVSAMHLGKAVIATKSSGIDEYAMNDFSSLNYCAGDVDDLVDKINRLDNDLNLCSKLGVNAKIFAREHLSEDGAISRLRQILKKRGLLSDV